MKTHAVVLLLGSALSTAGCVTVTDTNSDDPYEGFNRQMYAFNDGLDKAVIEPVAKGYRAVTNKSVREGVSNFVDNLSEPVTFANELLQGKLPNAARTVGRFVINSTLGIVGIFDPAGAIGIDRTDEDFGQTLGAWGFGGGPYLVLPILGSSNPRDLLGNGVDVGLSPLSYAAFEGEIELGVGKTILDALSGREAALETVENVRSTQLDPHTTLRRFYVRDRAAQIGNLPPVSIESEKVPDYELDF